MDGEVILNGFGEIVREEWFKTADIRREVVLDEFVAMPNHIHGIIIINNDVGATRWVAQNRVVSDCIGDEHKRATHRVAPTGPVAGSICAIVGQFKSIATKRINALRENPGCPVWQRGYYERIIRNDRELAGMREYIINNPMQWALDRVNPANIASEPATPTPM
ncbi:MAG: hypothetical protein NDI77_05385 [Geobacteraceae bacterium]|nr:hypothetical protein [Geobacteraceae bacterium]